MEHESIATVRDGERRLNGVLRARKRQTFDFTYEKQYFGTAYVNSRIADWHNRWRSGRHTHAELHIPFLTGQRLRHQIETHQLDEIFKYLHGHAQGTAEATQCVRSVRRSGHAGLEELFDDMHFLLRPLHRWLAVDAAQLQRRHLQMQRLHVRWVQRHLALQQLEFEEDDAWFCGGDECLLRNRGKYKA